MYPFSSTGEHKLLQNNNHYCSNINKPMISIYINLKSFTNYKYKLSIHCKNNLDMWLFVTYCGEFLFFFVNNFLLIISILPILIKTIL